MKLGIQEYFQKYKDNPRSDWISEYTKRVAQVEALKGKDASAISGDLLRDLWLKKANGIASVGLGFMYGDEFDALANELPEVTKKIIDYPSPRVLDEVIEWANRAVEQGKLKRVIRSVIFRIFAAANPLEYSTIVNRVDLEKLIKTLNSEYNLGIPIKGNWAEKNKMMMRALKEQGLANEDIYLVNTFAWELFVWLVKERGKENKDNNTLSIDCDHVLSAIEEINIRGVHRDEQSSTYDLIYAARRYPPKLVYALAHKYFRGEELDRSKFEGGENTECFRALRNLGFYIERKNYLNDLLEKFIKQADEENDLVVSSYPNSYCGLKVNVSFGKGNYAKIPWISFTGYEQTTSDGIYPVYLYYKSIGVLVLAKGVSETNKPSTEWTSSAQMQSVHDFLLHKYGVEPQRYGASWMHAAYKLPEELNMEQANLDLDRLIADYQSLMEEQTMKTGTENIISHEPEHWLFQANPKYYDIRGALDSLNQIKWSVAQSKHQLRNGQRGFLWESGGEGGVLASATLLSDPDELALDADDIRFSRAPEKFADVKLRAVVGIDKVLEQPITRSELLAHPILKDLGIFKFANATNFMLTQQEFDALQSMIDERSGRTVSRAQVPAGVGEPEPPPYSPADALDGLFMSEHRFDQMLGLLRLKKNLILQGPPGVGKTFVAKRLAYALMGQKAPRRVGMVQFHASYAYEDFIQGYRPTGSGFTLKDGIFHGFCTRAIQDPDHSYVFVIDEINRGNLSKVFGELMMLIEADKRGPDWAIPLTYSDGPDDVFFVPENLYLVGLMNTADRSLAMVDYALRRRFAFVDLEPGFDTDRFREFLNERGAKPELISEIVRKMGIVNEKIADDTANLGAGYRIGHSFFCAVPDGIKPDQDWFRQIVRSEIEPLLGEYWFDDVSRAEALVRDVLLT